MDKTGQCNVKKDGSSHNQTSLGHELAQLDPQSLKLYKVLSMKFDEGKNELASLFDTWSGQANERFSAIESRVEAHDKDIIQVKIDSNKEYVIIHGLKDVNPAPAQAKKEIVSRLNQLLDLQITTGDIHKVLVLGEKKQADTIQSGPVVVPAIKVCFMDLRTKCTVMDQRHKLKGKGIFINNDLPKE